jgi:serine/threonine-protein kinase
MSNVSQIGKYRVLEILGKGAMGVVYKAHDPHIDRTVAIKTVRKDVVDPDFAVQFMARFRNEARAAGRLHHPNIVGIYEYGEEGNIAYIAMEYVEGTGLREYLNRKARFDFAQIVAIMTQLLHALEYAHARGIVHRDIKPANLILTTNGALKIADFGIARIDMSNLTMDGMVMGTPSYMSPEQCRGEPNDERSDLFSAGVVFYELLTGEKPFSGSIESIAYQICHREPKPPTEISCLSLPREIDALFATALAKAPEARFQNARAFQDAMRTVVTGDMRALAASDATVLNLAEVELQPPSIAVWDDTVLNTIERQLARVVGPVAKMLVRRAATQAHDVTELYSLLSNSIDDAELRQRFAAERTIPDAGMSGSRPVMATTGSRVSAPHAERSRLTGTSRVATKPLDPSFVDETTARLAVYLGPIAKIVARKAAQQAKTQQEFVHIVAGQIGTQDRRSFLHEVGFDDA